MSFYLYEVNKISIITWSENYFKMCSPFEVYERLINKLSENVRHAEGNRK